MRKGRSKIIFIFFPLFLTANAVVAFASEPPFQPRETLPLTSFKWQRQQIRSMVKVYGRGSFVGDSESLRAADLYRETQENYNRLIDKMGVLIEAGTEADLGAFAQAAAEPAYQLELFLKEKTKARAKVTCWENCRFVLDAAKLNDVGRALVAKYKALPDPDVRLEQVEEEILALKLPQNMNQLF